MMGDGNMQITMNAHAKINLFLDITGRREDGYHTITGVMQSVSLADRVTVAVEEPVGKYLCAMGPRPGAAEHIALSCSDPNLPTDSKNLAWQAAEVFFAATGRGCRRLCIDIDKHIPAAAGMAGGSTDAAAVLSALNELFEHPLTDIELRTVGLKLGADVPFCLAGGTQMTEGIGEVLTPVAALPDCVVLVACAGERVSTPAAYGALDRLCDNFAPGAYTPRYTERNALIAALMAGDLDGVAKNAFNLFESVILPERPVAAKIREVMRSSGAVLSMMSGSGPSVFGLFRRGEKKTIADAVEALRAIGVESFVCEAIRG